MNNNHNNNLEESPLSDIRMDISEKTTSQESFSDIAEQRDHASTIMKNEDLATVEEFENDTSTNGSSNVKCLHENIQNSINEVISKINTTNISNVDSNSYNMEMDNQHPHVQQNIQHCINHDTKETFDNRNKISFNEKSLNHNHNSIIKSSLTLTNDHPLMLLNESNDSDIDNYKDDDDDDDVNEPPQFKHVNYNSSNNNNVVPVNEPLRLAIPRNSSSISNLTTPSCSPSSKKTTSPNSFTIKEHKINTTKITTTTTDSFNNNNRPKNNDSLKIRRRKISLPSNDQLSPINYLNNSQSNSDSEPDISQYHATVTSSFQAVALISNSTPKNIEHPHQREQRANRKQRATSSSTSKMVRRKISISSDLLSDDESNDTLSNRSFDEDIDDNLISVSQSSSIFDDTGFNTLQKDNYVVVNDENRHCGGSRSGGLSKTKCVRDANHYIASGMNNAYENNDDEDEEDDDDDDDDDHDDSDNDNNDDGGGGEPSKRNHLQLNEIAQYTAADEAKDLRNWQKITLPDGRTREIDMKVIDPYKRVLSHGGYLKAGGHNAIVVFSACYLPDRSRTDYHYVMDNLFLYVVKTLDQLVTEDYVFIYLHGGSSRSNVPSFPWLKKCYQLLDRRLRKSLKNLFMVHPTFWLKSVVWMARPFLSAKFWRKLVYVRTLEELYHLVPVEKAAVPDKVKKYDVKYT